MDFCLKPLPILTVGLTEEEAIAKLSGDIDVYVSKFKPMKYTLSGRDEKTIMKLIVQAETDRVVGCHMWVWTMCDVFSVGRGRQVGILRFRTAMLALQAFTNPMT